MPRSGMGSDPGGHQVWPFDPGLSQYTPTHMESPPFSPIWGATDSLLLSPAQSGLTEFPCYPLLLDSHSLHLSQEATGITSSGGESATPTSSTSTVCISVRRLRGITSSEGKSGAGLGSGDTRCMTLGHYTTGLGRFRPSGGPLTVLHCRPLRMGGCSPTVAPRGVRIRHLTPGHWTTGTWFKRWLPLSTFLSTNPTRTLPNCSHPTCTTHSSVCRLGNR